jgi:NAD(P)-dependent dehydrogenase (short-subunit alcohol dehydrogenase family)
VPIPGGSAYCVSKAGLNHFSRILSAEEPTICVVAINPGEMDTQMMAYIREKGQGVIPFESFHRLFVDYYERGLLPSPDVSALAAVTLALAAPLEMSGKYIDFQEEQGLQMVRECAALMEQTNRV